MAVSTNKPANRQQTVAEVAGAERLRIMGILESPEGLRNPDAARKLALTSNMSVEQSRDLLAGLPAANPYLAALDREGAVGISSGFAGDVFAAADPKEARKKELAENTRNYAKAQGYK